MSRLIDKRNGLAVCPMFRCGACGELQCDRIPKLSAGDECLNVCPECRTIEGDWQHVFSNEREEEVPEEYVTEVRV